MPSVNADGVVMDEAPRPIPVSAGDLLSMPHAYFRDRIAAGEELGDLIVQPGAPEAEDGDEGEVSDTEVSDTAVEEAVAEAEEPETVGAVSETEVSETEVREEEVEPAA